MVDCVCCLMMSCIDETRKNSINHGDLDHNKEMHQILCILNDCIMLISNDLEIFHKFLKCNTCITPQHNIKTLDDYFHAPTQLLSLLATLITLKKKNSFLWENNDLLWRGIVSVAEGKISSLACNEVRIYYKQDTK